MRAQLLTSAILANIPAWVRLPTTAWFVIALLHCSGCAIAGIDGPNAAAPSNDEDLRDYIERVFRLQNRVLSELMAKELDGDVDPLNAQLESSIVMNCRYLVESATLHMEGGEAPLTLKKKVLDTVEECENAAKAAETE